MAGEIRYRLLLVLSTDYLIPKSQLISLEVVGVSLNLLLRAPCSARVWMEDQDDIGHNETKWEHNRYNILFCRLGISHNSRDCGNAFTTKLILLRCIYTPTFAINVHISIIIDC